MEKSKFETDIVLGGIYKHKHSNIKGTAMSIGFYLYGCARVSILPKDSKDNNWISFDESELTGVESEDIGGPRQDISQRQ